MSAFATSQIISASCTDLINHFQTNHHISKPIYINEFIFRFELSLNIYKYLQLSLVLIDSPIHIEHIVLFCRFHCQLLTLLNEATLFKQITTLKNKNDRIPWPFRQLHITNCENHLKNTQKLEFQCDIQILQIKQKQHIPYIPSLQSVITFSNIQFEWNITEDILSSFKNAKCGRIYYSRNIHNIFNLCCYPNGNNNKTKGCLLLSLQLLRLPQIASMLINLRFECDNESWTRKECLFNYDETKQIWPSNLFKTSSLYSLESLTFNVSIQIVRISNINGKEIPKETWHRYGIESQTQYGIVQDIERQIDSIQGFEQKEFPQQIVLNTERDVIEDDDEKENEDILQIKFEQWLCNSLELGQYLIVFQRNNKADISQIRYFTDVMLRDIGIGDEYHRQIVLESAHDFGRKQSEFEGILRNNHILGVYKEQLRMNGILTIYDVQREIRSKHDIERIFDVYGEDDQIDQIWNTVDRSYAQTQTVTLQEECKEMAQKMRMIQQRIRTLHNNMHSQTMPLRVQQNNVITDFLSNVQKYQLSISALQYFQQNSSRNSMSSDTGKMVKRCMTLRQSSTATSSSDNSNSLTVMGSYSHLPSQNVLGIEVEFHT